MVKKNESALNLFKGTRQEISLRKLRVKKKMSHDLIKYTCRNRQTRGCFFIIRVKKLFCLQIFLSADFVFSLTYIVSLGLKAEDVIEHVT